MKATNKKPLFRNCPNSDIFKSYLCSDCRRCELYEDCLDRKVKRVANRRKTSVTRNCRKRFIFKTALIFCGSILILLYINFNSVAEENTTTPIIITQSIETIEPVVSEKYQAVEINTGILNESELNLKSEEKLNNDLEPEKPTLSAYSPSSEYYYIISDEDKMYIRKLLYKEARGEAYEGKVAVAAVVLNRYSSNDKRFERESIYSVITQSGAFAPIDDVTQEMLDTVPDLLNAVEDACHGWDPTRKKFENGALFFYAPKEVSGYQKEIREGIEILQIGNHNFHIDLND